MTDQRLELRLRSALNTEADRAPLPGVSAADIRALSTASSQVTARPIAIRSRRRAAWIGVAAASIAGATAAVVGLLGGGASPAFASWTSSPEPISTPQSAAVDRACAVLDGSNSTATSADRPVLVDRRGHSAYAVYSDGTTWNDCLQTIPGLTPDKGLPDGWFTHGRLTDVATSTTSQAEPLVVLSAKSPEGNDVRQSPVTWVSGRYSPVVARIVITTPSGTVVPTMADGVYAAWWPGNDGDRDVVRAYDRSGYLLSTIDQWNCGDVAHPVAPRIQVTGRPATGGCR